MTRKLYYLIPCLMMAMVTFTGCGDDNNDGPTGGDVLSAEKSKEKLSEIGQNLINLVNADDQKQTVVTSRELLLGNRRLFGNSGKSKCTADGTFFSSCFTG